MTKKLRVGVLGAGRIGKIHGRTCATMCPMWKW